MNRKSIWFTLFYDTNFEILRKVNKNIFSDCCFYEKNELLE